MRNYTDTEADLEYLPNRTAYREYAIPERDDVDNLVDSLWRHGSAQDYPAPEPEYPARLQVKHLNERRWSHYHEYTDQRSRTHDLKLDEPPVPGYRDFPTAIAKTINFENAHAKQITQASRNSAQFWEPLK